MNQARQNHKICRSLGLFTVISAIALSLSFAAGHVIASGLDREVTKEDFKVERVYSPYADRAYADNIFFGDTHFHTELSFDAGLVGTSLNVHDGFRMARGETVISNTGQRVQLIRPLDFLFITDHAELIGLAPAIRESNPLLLSDPWGAWVHERFNSGPDGRMEAFADIIQKATVEGINPFSSDELAQLIWQDFIKIADQYNQPGVFSAMTGYEWSSTPKGDNLHRVVLFRDGAEKTSQTVPYSMFDSDDPEGLWDYLASYEAKDRWWRHRRSAQWQYQQWPDVQ